MKGNKVTSRYAKALLDLAVEQNVLDKVNADMINLVEVFEASKDPTCFKKSRNFTQAKGRNSLESTAKIWN
ncbi:MAG: F0F1 ATP synthase subunit delta [Crocinitomicaceae bacterium]|nr:F0F1 ATP synthase subunit delta [Crocinitomicaceae bacterium]